MSKVDDGLRPLFRKHLPMFDWQSIETGGTGRGVPDSNYCYKGYEGWVEFKSTDGWTVGLRPEQIGWITRRVRHGGRVLIAVRRRHDGGPRRGPPADELYMIHGGQAVPACMLGLRVCPNLGVWQGGPSQWNWNMVQVLLTA